MLIAYFLPFLIRGEILNLTILYEKAVDDNVEELYKSIMEGIVKKYNSFLYIHRIYIRLETMMSYNEYLEEKQFKNLSKVGGKKSLEDRMMELAKIDKNILLIASVPGEEEDLKKDFDKPCRSKYITTFSNTNNMGDDTLSNMLKSFRNWMSHIFKYKAPNPIGKDSLVSIEKFSNLVGQSNFLKSLEHCNAQLNDITIQSIPKHDIDEYSQFNRVLEEILELLKHPEIIEVLKETLKKKKHREISTPDSDKNELMSVLTEVINQSKKTQDASVQTDQNLEKNTLDIRKPSRKRKRMMG